MRCQICAKTQVVFAKGIPLCIDHQFEFLNDEYGFIKRYHLENQLKEKGYKKDILTRKWVREVSTEQPT